MHRERQKESMRDKPCSVSHALSQEPLHTPLLLCLGPDFAPQLDVHVDVKPSSHIEN